MSRSNPGPPATPAQSGAASEKPLSDSRRGLASLRCELALVLHVIGKGAPAAPYAASRDKVGGEEQGDHTPLPLASA